MKDAGFGVCGAGCGVHQVVPEEAGAMVAEAETVAVTLALRAPHEKSAYAPPPVEERASNKLGRRAAARVRSPEYSSTTSCQPECHVSTQSRSTSRVMD